MGDRMLTALDPAYVRLLRLNGALAGAALIAAAFAAEIIFGGRLGLARGMLAAPAVVGFLYLALLSPGRRYRAWGYAMDGEALHVGHGVLTQVHTIVPLARVQHIDVSQGPLERALALSRLVLHTAGTQHSQIVLPGLRRETAEAMREAIRGRMAREEE